MWISKVALKSSKKNVDPKSTFHHYVAIFKQQWQDKVNIWSF